MFLGICNAVKILQKGCHLKYIFEMVNVSHPINITLLVDAKSKILRRL